MFTFFNVFLMLRLYVSKKRTIFVTLLERRGEGSKKKTSPLGF